MYGFTWLQPLSSMACATRLCPAQLKCVCLVFAACGILVEGATSCFRRFQAIGEIGIEQATSLSTVRGSGCGLEVELPRQAVRIAISDALGAAPLPWDQFKDKYSAPESHHAAYRDLFDISFSLLATEARSAMNADYPEISITGDSNILQSDSTRKAVVEVATGPVPITDNATDFERRLMRTHEVLMCFSSLPLGSTSVTDVGASMGLLPTLPPAVLGMVAFEKESHVDVAGPQHPWGVQANVEVGCDRMATTEFGKLFAGAKFGACYTGFILWQQARTCWEALAPDALPGAGKGNQVAGWLTTLLFSRLAARGDSESYVQYKNSFGIMPRVDMHAWLLSMAQNPGASVPPGGPPPAAIADVLQALGSAPEAAARCVAASGADFISVVGVLRDVFRLGAYLQTTVAAGSGALPTVPQLRSFCEAARPRIALGAWRKPNAMQDIAPTCAADGGCLCVVEDRECGTVALHVEAALEKGGEALSLVSLQAAGILQDVRPFALRENSRISAAWASQRWPTPSAADRLRVLAEDWRAHDSSHWSDDMVGRALVLLFAVCMEKNGTLVEVQHFEAAATVDALAFLGSPLRELYFEGLQSILTWVVPNLEKSELVDDVSALVAFFQIGRVLQQLVLNTIDLLAWQVAPAGVTIGILEDDEVALWEGLTFKVPWGYAPRAREALGDRVSTFSQLAEAGASLGFDFDDEKLVEATEADALVRLFARSDPGVLYDLQEIAKEASTWRNQTALSQGGAMADAVQAEVGRLGRLRQWVSALA